MPEKEIEIIAVATGELAGSNENTGTVSTVAATYSGSLEARNAADGTVDAINSLTGTLGALIDDDSFNGSIAAMDVHNGATSGTLTLRIGQDGHDGKDGFSPTISVYKDTKTEYILKITNKDGSYLTPNLYPDLEGLQDVEALVAGKVDKILSTYPTLDATQLNEAQRDTSYLYVNATEDKFTKMPLSVVALQPEVEDRLRTKVRTIDKRPSSDWRLGDYIFLDIVQEDGE